MIEKITPKTGKTHFINESLEQFVIANILYSDMRHKITNEWMIKIKC